MPASGLPVPRDQRTPRKRGALHHEFTNPVLHAHDGLVLARQPQERGVVRGLEVANCAWP